MMSFGIKFGKKTVKNVEVTEDSALITFHSDSYKERRGFRILFHIKDSGSNLTIIDTVLNQIYISGGYAVITFQSESQEERKGFRVLFNIKGRGSNSTTIGVVFKRFSIRSQ